jgi:hypothetical protein
MKRLVMAKPISSAESFCSPSTRSDGCSEERAVKDRRPPSFLSAGALQVNAL